MIRLGPAGTDGETLTGLGSVASKGLTACEIEFTYGVSMKEELAGEVKKLNRRLGLMLSVHAPYYINLSSAEKQKVSASRIRILDSCRRAHQMGAEYVVFHAGFYGNMGQDECYEMIKAQTEKLLDEVRSNRWKVQLAPETTGKLSQFGNLDELIRLREETGASLCVDFSHIYARNNGKISYMEIFDKLKRINHIHSHFSGIEFTAKGERRHLVLEKSFFRPLASEVLRRKKDITIICESPVTWKDSLVMADVLKEEGWKGGV